MPTYITLIKLTDQGRRNLKQLPQGVHQAMQQAAQQGVTFRGWYLTMGAYDAVAVVEAPSDEVVLTGLLAEAMRGDIAPLTMRAFTIEETEALVGRLPTPS